MIGSLAMANPHQDRYFGCSTDALSLARQLYKRMAEFPILSPHGHVNPELLASNNAFSDPVALLITPDRSEEHTSELQSH